MSEPLETEPTFSDKTDELAPRMASVGPVPREELIGRLKASASQRAAQVMEQQEPSAAPEALTQPETAMSRSSDEDEEPPCAQTEHARVMEVLDSSAWRKRLEEARAQREKVLASRLAGHGNQGDGQAGGRDLAVARSISPSAPNEMEPRLPLLHAPLQLASAGPVGRLEGSVLLSRRGSREWRPHWALSLSIGLIFGLALGVGLMRLTGSEPPFLFGLPDASGGPEGVSAATAAISTSTELATISAFAAAVEVVPPAPILMVRPHTAYVDVPSGSDHRPMRPRFGRLDVPQVADSRPAPTESAGAPANAGQWRPSPLPGPEPSDVVELAAGTPSAAFSPRSAQALVSPSPPDPASSLAEGRMAEDAPLDVVGVVQTSAGTSEDLPPRAALHLSPDLSQAAVDEARAALRNAGIELASSRATSNSFSRSQVFFFHQVDAPDAARMADAIGAQVRDFSSYRPSPERGKLEVWIAPDG